MGLVCLTSGREMKVHDGGNCEMNTLYFLVAREGGGGIYCVRRRPTVVCDVLLTTHSFKIIQKNETAPPGRNSLATYVPVDGFHHGLELLHLLCDV